MFNINLTDICTGDIIFTAIEVYRSQNKNMKLTFILQCDSVCLNLRDCIHFKGELYEKGLGVPQDSAKAAYWTKKGIYLRSWIYNMKTLFQRHNRYKKLNELIAKVTNPEVKDNLIKTRDEYWRRIQLLNKPNFTDEDYYQIKQEHERIDDLISKMEKLI